MLTKRTYSVLVLLVALAVPAVAIAAPGDGPAGVETAAPGAGPDGVETAGSDAAVGASQPAAAAPLTRPARRFQRTIRTHVQRIRAERRARRAERRARIEREREEAFATLPGGVSMATLEAIASCESGGSPTIVSADGSYRGKYQFSFETWASVGGSGDPAAAPESEQDYRAALLYSQSGSSPWPVCG